jgi:hypothetical protein
MALIPNRIPDKQLDLRRIPSETQWSDEDFGLLIKKDEQAANSFLGEKQWPLRWREIDILYQSPRPLTTWEGTTVAEANVTSFTIAKHVNSIVPQIMAGLTYDDPPFILRPRPGTNQNVVRAKTAVFSTHLDQMKFEEQIEDGWFYTALFGTAIYKWGYINCTETEPRYVRKSQPLNVNGTLVPTEESDELEVHEIEKHISRPHLEHVPLDQVLVDPSLEFPDIRKAKWVEHVMYLTLDDLLKLMTEPWWKGGSEEEVRSWFEIPVEQARLPGTQEVAMSGQGVVAHAAPRYLASSVDPYKQPLKVVERWDCDKVGTLVQDKKMIRNEANPFGKIPFYSSHWWRIPKSFYSLGIGNLVGQDQRVQQGLRNAALNLLGLAVNPNYLRSRGANVPTQQIRQRRGGIIDVDGPVAEAFKILEIPKVPPEVWTALQNSEMESESASGADQRLVQGNTAGAGTSMGRTAGGAATLAAASANKLSGPVSRFIDTVMQPWIYQMDELDKERLPLSTLRDILGDQLGKEFTVNVEDYFNAKLQYEILAGARLAAKRGMAQALPLISQIFENPQILQDLNQRGWTIDTMELLAMFMEVSDWKNQRTLIRPLTPQEKAYKAQQMQMMAQAKTAPQMALDNNKAKNKADLSIQTADQKAEFKVMELGLEHAIQTGSNVLGGPDNGLTQ